MNPEYNFYVAEIPNLDFEDAGKDPGTHWEAIRSRQTANGDTWHDRLGYRDTKEEAERVLAKWTGRGALAFALAAMLLFSSCSVARREGTTSPCYQKQFKATHVTQRKVY